MKKILLIAALMGSFSLASMASDAPNKKGEFSSRAVMQKTTARSVNNFKKLKPQECGWQRYSIGCGGPYDYMGNAYCCTGDDLLFAKMTTYELYC